MLLEQTNLNEYAIKLESNKQLPYKQIYSLGTVELETLKVYIKIYSKISFLLFSKSLADIFILFDKKLDSSLCFYINY